MEPRIALEIETAQVPAYEDSARAEGLELEAFDLKRFDGGLAITTIVLPLIAATLPFITKAYLAEVAARRYIKAKVDGIELQGLTADEIVKIMRERSNLVDPKK